MSSLEELRSRAHHRAEIIASLEQSYKDKIEHENLPTSLERLSSRAKTNRVVKSILGEHDLRAQTKMIEGLHNKTVILENVKKNTPKKNLSMTKR
jgi:hypothetical protein